jgi:hypothetical protein
MNSSVVGLLILILGCFAAYWVIFERPVMEFAKEENNSIIKFDLLNENIAKDIPLPPDRVKLEKIYKLGIDDSKPIHGRQLVAYYSVTGETNMTDEEILSYYQSNLQLKGWNVLEDNRSIYFQGIELKKDTACIMIEFILEEYEITVWHDYLKQNFSPTLPDKWLLDIIDAGKTDIWTCPYGG